MEIEPNQTIYVKNINEKVKKDVLKKQLYMLFSQYGRVKQIVACKGIKLRGQDVNAAANALKAKQGFIFYDKPMQLSFAKAKSHSVARAEGKGPTTVQNTSKTAKRSRGDSDAEEEDVDAAKAARVE